MSYNMPQNGWKNAGRRKDSLVECHYDPYYQQKRLRSEDCATISGGRTEFNSETESRILVLYTGGTIGMRNVDGAYRPAPRYIVTQLRRIPMFNDPEYATSINTRADVAETITNPALAMPVSKDGKRICYTVWEYEPLLDSCNMTMTDWARLALDIKKNYYRFDGFVVLHGTDTMAYTASALSFMLENLGKPVIITGSQIPIFETRSDGRDNFLGALIMAGHYCIPEVTIYFNNKLLRGNRAIKVDAGGFDAFHTPNLPPLAELEIDITVNWGTVFRPTNLAPFQVHTNLCPNVGILRLFPSITIATVRAFLQPPMEGVVIQTYGAGNGPDARDDLLHMFKEASNRGVVIVNTTQCAKGSVSASYATGKALQEVGIVPGLDLTPEAALTKLSYVLGKNHWSVQTKREMMGTNLRGEMRVVAQKNTILDMGRLEISPRESLLEFPLLAKMQDTMRLSSDQEVQMLKTAIFPALLCAAAREANIEALQSLRGAGAHFNQCDYDGRTALHIAAGQGHEATVRFLLQDGGLVHQRDRYGLTPLDDAVHFNRHAVIKLLRTAGAHLNVPSFKLGTLLCSAVVHRDFAQLKSWHLAGADVNQGDYDKRTALHVACNYGYKEITEELLRMGAKPDVHDIFKRTPLDEARQRGFADIITLIQQQATDSLSFPCSRDGQNGTAGTGE